MICHMKGCRHFGRADSCRHALVDPILAAASITGIAHNVCTECREVFVSQSALLSHLCPALPVTGRVRDRHDSSSGVSKTAATQVDDCRTAGVQVTTVSESSGSDTHICEGCTKRIPPLTLPARVELFVHGAPPVGGELSVRTRDISFFCSVVCMRDWCNRILEIG